jgi:hypothetical protein
MNVHRKIQLTAAAVIANATLALGLLSPTSALATTCVPQSTGCSIDFDICNSGPTFLANFCNVNYPPPPGCTFASATCSICNPEFLFSDVTCHYKST